MINLHERMLPTLAGVEPSTSWSPVGRRIQLSHRGRLHDTLINDIVSFDQLGQDLDMDTHWKCQNMDVEIDIQNANVISYHYYVTEY